MGVFSEHSVLAVSTGCIPAFPQVLDPGRRSSRIVDSDGHWSAILEKNFGTKRMVYALTFSRSFGCQLTWAVSDK